MSEDNLNTDEKTFEQHNQDEYHVRQQKLDQWKKDHDFHYQNSFKPKNLAQDLQELYQENLPEQEEKFSLAGRLMLKRVMGKAAFFTLQDRTGRLQLYGRVQELGAEQMALFKTLDLGDIVYVQGFLFRTRTGELTLHLEDFSLVNKALRPLPEKFHGIADTEFQYRHRYVDLIVTEKSKETFKFRSKLVSFMRQFFEKRDYLEVETPMMQTIPGGANARPFITHHHALSMDLFLRIAPELYLKRLVVGGFERVFEINRNFRNEGLSTKHNPEFTMIEFYQAYATYEDLMQLTEEFFQELIQAYPQCAQVPGPNGQTINLSAPFKKMTLEQSLIEVSGLSPEQANDKSFLAKELKVDADQSLGALQFAYFEEHIEDKLIQPTFITGYPISVSPLAKRSHENPELTDRFELFIAGREISNGFSELNDPADQASRFEAQVCAKDDGDQEAMYYDQDYIQALEYAMPPTAGQGIGIDRLVMLLTGSTSIKDVILFPTLRPKG